MADSKKRKLEPDATAVTTKPSIHNMRSADLIKQLQEERQQNELIAIRNESAFKRDLDVFYKVNQELTAERDSLLQQLQEELSKNEVQTQQQLQQPEQLQQFVVKIQELTTERDSLLHQLQQEMSKCEALRQQQLQQFVVKIQELTTERDSMLHQLQQEVSKCEALRQQLLEHEKSQQAILNSVIEENTIRVQEMSQQIEELTDQCRVFHDEKHDLKEQLDQINEQNTCSICLSPWEAQGAHRIVSLRCGHLFGKECLLQQLEHRPECPICKQEVQNGDTRYIFGCRISAV